AVFASRKRASAGTGLPARCAWTRRVRRELHSLLFECGDGGAGVDLQRASYGKISSLNSAGGGECEVLLPLPPQIISLADLEATVNSQPAGTLEIRGDKLAWIGKLQSAPMPMSIAYSAVGKGLYSLQTPPGGILDSFHIDLTAIGSD